MRSTQPTVRFAISLLVISAFLANGCAKDQSRVAASGSGVVPAPPGEIKPPVPRSLPGKLDVQVGWVPDGYVRTNGQMTLFTLGGSSGESHNEAPSFFRTWMREDGWTKDKGGEPSAIVIVIESSAFDNPIVSPRRKGADREVLRDVRDTSVFIEPKPTGGRFVRWTEGELDVMVSLSGPDWDDSSTRRLIRSIQLIRS